MTAPTWDVDVEVEQVAQLEPAIAHQIRTGILHSPEFSDDAERVIRMLARVVKDPDFKPASHEFRRVPKDMRRVLQFKASGSFVANETHIEFSIISTDVTALVDDVGHAAAQPTPPRVPDLSEEEFDGDENEFEKMDREEQAKAKKAAAKKASK